MGLLLLLTSTLLSSYFHPGGVVSAQIEFTIKEISLSIEPKTDVTRGTNVTLRCKAIVSRSGREALSREYTIYRDNNVMYTKTTSTSEDLLYPLPDVRVSNNGKYKCMIKIEDKERTSGAEKLTVTGLSKPILRINSSQINEGDELTARCTAPGETGLIYFYFYEDSKEIQYRQVNSNQVEVKFRSSSTGNHNIHCDYTVSITPHSFKSEKSETVTVSVRMLPITVVLEISPQHNIFEGDQLTISCTINNTLHGSEKGHLFLIQGPKILSFGETKVNHSMNARAHDPGEFECKLEMGNIVKYATKTISVTELFSIPNLTMTPPEVFEGDDINITCKSSYAHERLRKEELSYTLRLDRHQGRLSDEGNGVFSGRVLQNFNCTCEARAKGIVKYSETLTVHPKVHVTTPEISVDGEAVLGRSFRVLCKSNDGSLPINYTLMKEGKFVSSIIVKQPHQQAFFPVTVKSPDEINKYKCKAKNGPKEGLLSKRLDATVVVPLSDPTLTVLPSLSDISEGDDLYLICSIRGSSPVTFKWYRVGNLKPLYTVTSHNNHSDYTVHSLSKDHSGSYYCEALNHANNVRSGEITIDVHMALWKKAVIGGFCLLAVAVLVVVLVLFFKSKRGKREAAAELSVKPSSPKSDDSLTVNLTHDTEVYNAATVRVDRAAVSVWTKRPPEDDEDNDEESNMVSNEPDVEYTEVVHPQPVDPARVPLRKGTDTVYSELQNSPHGAADHHAYGSVEYAALNGEQPEINHYHPEVNNYQDLPVPVD